MLRADEFGIELKLGGIDKFVITGWGAISFKSEGYYYKPPEAFLPENGNLFDNNRPLKLEWKDVVDDPAYDKEIKDAAKASSEDTKIWLGLEVIMSFILASQSFQLGIYFKDWWDGAFGVKFLNIGDIWGVIQVGNACAATFMICEIGMGFGVKLIKSNYPEAPLEIDVEAGTEIMANFYIAFIPKVEEELSTALVQVPPNAGSARSRLMQIRDDGDDDGASSAADDAASEAAGEAADAVLDRLNMEFFLDIRIKNFGFWHIANAVNASEGTLQVCKALPTIEKLNIMFAIGDGEIGRCPGEYPVCIEYEPGLEIDMKIVWWKIIIEFQMKVTLPPNDPDFMFAFRIQIPDIVGELFKLLYEEVKTDPVMVELLKGVLSVFKELGLMPILEVANLQLHPFSIRQYKDGKLPFHFEIDVTVFGLNIQKEWEFWNKDADDIGNPASIDDKEDTASLVQMRVQKKMRAMGKCHPDHHEDLLHDPDNCSSEEMRLIALTTQEMPEGEEPEEGEMSMMDSLTVRAITMATEKILGFIAKVMNFCLGLFGFRLVITLHKVGIAGEYIDITLESYKNVFLALLETLGTFLLNILKRLVNLVLRPIPFLSPISIYECTPKEFSIEQVWEDEGYELYGNQEEMRDNCTAAAYDDTSYCKFINNETNNMLPLHERALMDPADCNKNFKCYDDGKGNFPCTSSAYSVCSCVEKSKKDKCNAEPFTGCRWRDVEDYEEEEFSMLQTKYAQHIR